jgi:hypothetical protein
MNGSSSGIPPSVDNGDNPSGAAVSAWLEHLELKNFKRWGEKFPA